jgi:PBP1b-binding outer membrane lipoprotein LpoB
MKYQLIILILLIGLMLTGCGWQFAMFTYEAVIEAEPAVEHLVDAPPVVDAEGAPVDTALTLPVGVSLGNPVADIFSQIIANSGAVDATKTIAICIVGDPAAIGAFRADPRLIKKITTTKRFFVIKTKDSK